MRKSPASATSSARVQQDAAKFQPECICVNLRRAARAVSQLYDDALAASGLKITQFSLLRAIQRNTLQKNQRASINLLAEEMELDRSTLARNLRPLERDGLITLSPGRDKRVVEAHLTLAGAAAIASAVPLWRVVQQDVAARLGATRAHQLRKIAAYATGLVTPPV
jgi:DNA-binding MarR family transcriptional regulator